MKVLVTGASGFIGGHIVRRLTARGIYDVQGLGRTHLAQLENFPSEHAQYIQADLTTLAGRTFDAEICVHVAALANDHASWSVYMKENVQATKTLLAALPNCKIFIFISSSSVYDFSDGQPKQEEDALLSARLSMYGKSKLLAEMLIRDWASISSRYILRPRAVYGSGDRVLLPRIQRLIWKGLFFLPGNLQVLSSLTNVNFLVDAVENAMQEHSDGVHTFNIADPKPYLLREKFEALGTELAGKPLHLVSLPMSLLMTVAKILQFLKISSNLSPQALHYLSQNSVLDTKKYQQRLSQQPASGS